MLYSVAMNFTTESLKENKAMKLTPSATDPLIHKLLTANAIYIFINCIYRA